jgi:hypothetical protein
MEETIEYAIAAKVKIEPAENVVEVDAAEQVFLTETLNPGESARVVVAAFFRIGQYGVSLGDFPETLLRPRLLVAVRVIFHGKVAKGVLDRLLPGVTGYAEYLVVVAFVANDNSL